MIYILNHFPFCDWALVQYHTITNLNCDWIVFYHSIFDWKLIRIMIGHSQSICLLDNYIPFCDWTFTKRTGNRCLSLQEFCDTEPENMKCTE